MIKQIAMLGILVLITSSQNTVTPKTQQCECQNILNQQDCGSQQGCFWKFSNSNNTESTNNTLPTGSCYSVNSTAQFSNQSSPITQCTTITNQTLCSKMLGCAYFNNTCILFSGCSAYVQTTNSLCQAISFQCTTDGMRCVDPSPCQSYNISSLCLDNIASSGAKTCKWVETGSQIGCIDKVCSDAPNTFNTDQLCNGWIVGCLSTGQGCTQTLQSCSTYPKAAGCSGMIGSDGPCTENSDQGSSVCRPLSCTDAPTTFSTNTDCSKFLQGCLTTGKGCVKTLQFCNLYQQSLGCASLIGTEGPCTIDTTSTTACRALQCNDAPTSLNTNSGCNQFLNNCVTTGQGCTRTLGLCSSYIGNESQCILYIGSDGNCRGAGQSGQSCTVRTCGDASKSINTDQGCNSYQKGCITNGAGCVVTLQLCQQYVGTATTCLLLKGSDGNCTAPSSQTADGPCTVKVCSDAQQNMTTNAGCQQYSYKCVTNGTECIQQPTCETTQQVITCEGNSACSSSQICLDRSSCANYSIQSICSLNQQQYKVGSKTYLRKCQWTTSCQNILCSSLSTTLKTDSACETALQGCVTTGNGCVDINDNCTAYSGSISTCQGYKGLNGQQACTQLKTETNTSASCVAITECSQAKLYSSITQTSNSTCDTFLKGCSFNGQDNCTSGDCNNFIGNLAFCQSVSTAVSSNKPQKCWKVDQPNSVSTVCIPRTCAHATPTLSEPFSSDSQCQAFLSNCVWNGKSTGGCQDFYPACTSFVGSFAQCSQYSEQRCTKSSNQESQYCKSTSCSANALNTSQSQADQQKYCQGLFDTAGYNCYVNGGTSCKTPINIYVSSKILCSYYIPIGANDNEKNTFCQTIKIPLIQCKYVSGESNCNYLRCSEFSAVGDTADQKAAYCMTKREQNNENAVQCGLKNTIDNSCSLFDCNSQGLNTKALCFQYNCNWNSFANMCSSFECNAQIPLLYSSLDEKKNFCEGFSCNYFENGCHQRIDCRFLSISEGLTLQQTQQACLHFKDEQGRQCGQIQNEGYLCFTLECSNLLIFDYNSDIESQQFCQSYAHYNGQPCGYDESNKASCTLHSNCSSYKTFGADNAANVQLCKKYKANTQLCTYSSGSTCSSFSCNDIGTKSIASCQTNHPYCQYDGVTCITNILECTDYTAQTVGDGQLANCLNLKNKNDSQCGFSQGAKCKNKDCTDITSGGSEVICSAYIQNCQFNGVGCSPPGACETYTAFGSNLTEMAAFCKSRVPTGNVKCTYVAGETKCSLPLDTCSNYLISKFTGTTSQIGCGLVVDKDGAQCSYSSGASCTNLSCEGAPSTVNSDLACSNFRYGCILTPQTECVDKKCIDAPNTTTSDTACAIYRVGCITNGAGCIESNSSCSDFKGTATICANFKANNGFQLCGNNISAIATNPCSNRTCQQNTTAKNDQDCDLWFPPTGNTKNCVWNGANGCIPPQQCSSFQGTVDTCPKFTATDGPCQGTNSSTSACTPYVCSNAPSTYNTDLQCKQWGPTCMTNGQGCIPIGQCQSIGSHPVCSTYKNSLGCDLANQCRTKPQQCSDFTNPSECNNTPIAGVTLAGCGWNPKTNSCGLLTCINLPLTLTTDLQCSQSISNCTTTGSGCIIKAACSTYTRQVCGIAATTDTQKACIWSNLACRPIQCTDNMSATSDAACDSYLTGCKTTGVGCASNLTCPLIITSQLCIKDTNGNPCLWLKTQQNQLGSCINYTKCTDVISSSHQGCQNASPQCTTNGINCIAITSCVKTLLQASCIIGTDGTCGWLPAQGSTNGSCAVYTNCTAAKATTTQQCKLWGKSCVSDGVSCIEISTCSSYLTQSACANQGTDGVCFWEISQGQQQGTCRLQLCSDATTNNNTHSGCSQFKANTPCTTSETSCIPLSTCKSYKVQAGCVRGTDGECFWQSSSSNSTDQPQCRLKQCTDITLTTSSACLHSISGLKCVSNGVNCIQWSLCQNYTTREACLGGGTDGQCAFVPNSIKDQSNGQCQIFSICNSADQDQVTCSTRQDSCYFNSTTINGTTTTQCQSHTCQTRALASSCQPIPSLDLQTYQICVLTGTICSSGSPSQLTSADCFQNSVQTYSWNPQTSSCRACKVSSQINNTNNQSNQTRGDSYGYMIGIYMIIAFQSI